MSKGKNFGIPSDTMPIWETLTKADYSFVESGKNAVELYLLSMAIGLRLGGTPKLIALTDNFQYGGVAKRCDIEMLSRLYGISPELSVSTLGRYAGIGINYISRHHFDRETEIIDLRGIYESFAYNDILECESCGKYNSPDCEICVCKS